MNEGTTRTVREALEQIHCPKCGAEPGEYCHSDSEPPAGKHPMHTARMLAPKPTKKRTNIT